MSYILDTSFIAAGDGSLFQNAKTNLDKLSKLKLPLFTSPGVIQEISCFTGHEFNDLLNKIFKIETVNLYNAHLPAKLVCIVLDQLRERNKNLLKKTETLILSEKPTDQKVGRLRGLFRETLYSGVLDSSTDIEIALLARKKRGILITRDEGLMKFAKEIGVAVNNNIE